jgi:hypothetical protein
LSSSKDKAPDLSAASARDREPGRPIELAGKKEIAAIFNATLRLARRALARDFAVMQKIANCIAIAQAQIIAAPLLAKRAISRASGQKRPRFHRMELARRLRSQWQSGCAHLDSQTTTLTGKVFNEQAWLKLD